MYKTASFLFFFCLLTASLAAQYRHVAPAGCGPLPDSNQLRWQQMEYYAFVHLSVNTYTDMAWGNGNEDPAMFNPAQLDCNEWARLCKAAGMKGIIITAKHHSGFCLWPSAYTDYSVKNAPWKNGKGDIVRELADACKANGLKLGIYLSPWDRHHPDYGKPAYIEYFRNQLRELLTNYGEIFEIWFDGANGGSGYYGGANETRKIDRSTYYDWPNTYKLVRSLQPNIVIWNDGGNRADLRWVGTEAGYVGETNWSLLNATGDVPDTMLRYGVENGNAWVPAEVNTSIRPEWFYHPKEDNKVKTLPQLLDIYYHSIGRNASLLLNFPIMPNGRIHERDQQAVLQLAKAVKEAFAVNLARNAAASASNVRNKSTAFSAAKAIDDNASTYWATEDSVSTGTINIQFAKPVTFNRLVLKEFIALGQRVQSFTVEAKVNGLWQPLAKETTIGYKRILRLQTVHATALRIHITAAKCSPLIAGVEVYQAPVILAPPVLLRAQSGLVQVSAADAGAEVYYTLDGTLPTIHASKYVSPVPTGEGSVRVRAVAYDPLTKKYSEPVDQWFGIARKHWTIMGVQDSAAYQLLDGDAGTQWYAPQASNMPVDLVIDLGREENIRGFRYLPDQHWWASGIISSYRFFVSANGVEWTMADAGEFANIKNNPVEQSKTFTPQRARFIKLQALQNTQGDNRVGYAEFDIITDEPRR